LEKLSFLLVQDLFLHETVAIADVVLPATSVAEKEDTFTNSERRVQWVRTALRPIGASRPDWQIACDLARRVARRLGTDESQFAFANPAAVWDEMARVAPSLSSISFERLDGEGGIQWPCPSAEHPGTPRLYGESVTVSSRRGEIEATVLITDAMRPGEVFIPFVQLQGAAVNFLTNNVYDPTAKIPEYKVCAVRIDKPGDARTWRRERRGHDSTQRDDALVREVAPQRAR
jgi:predicted molibdopterin-dependent oxidoreductase YjgC